MRNEHASLLRLINNPGSFLKTQTKYQRRKQFARIATFGFHKDVNFMYFKKRISPVFQKPCISNGRRFSAAVSSFPHSRCPRRCVMLPCLDPSRRLTVLISHCETHSQGLINKMKDNKSVVTTFPLVVCEFMKVQRVHALIIHCANFSTPSFVTVHPLSSWLSYCIVEEII